MWTNLSTTINNSFSGNVEYVPVVFQNSDLAAGVLNIPHGRDTLFVIPEAIYNPSGVLQDQSGIFTIMDSNNVKYEFGGNLETGKYLFIFKFLYL